MTSTPEMFTICLITVKFDDSRLVIILAVELKLR